MPQGYRRHRTYGVEQLRFAPMAVSASFEPGQVSSEPGGTAALTLRLQNDAEIDQVVKLRASGELASQTVLQSETVYLDPNETFEVPVIVDVSPALAAGPHSSTIKISDGNGEASVAEATIEVLETTGYQLALTPEVSRSSAAGKHKLTVDNTGNVPVVVELTAESVEEGVEVELAAPAINVYPSDQAKVEIRVVPPSRFWSGPNQRHEFVVKAAGSDGVTQQFDGVFEQGPRLRPWLLPALVGAGIALLLGTILWFTVLEPRVEDIAESKAVEAILADREALRERIIELEEAAAEAAELPLGAPADLRLATSAAAGATASESFAVSADRVLSVTDVVFQNPEGAVGQVSLLRDGQVLLQSELANFRDLDFHFVAPFRFDGGSAIELRVACTTPGPAATECNVAATIIGFVDEAT